MISPNLVLVSYDSECGSFSFFFTLALPCVDSHLMTQNIAVFSEGTFDETLVIVGGRLKWITVFVTT